MYFIFTDEHGFEPTVFTNKHAARTAAAEMRPLAAYLGCSVYVFFAAEADLRRIMTVDLDPT